MSPVATFVDTSALYALLSASDAEHDRARRAFQDLVAGEERLLTHNYVLVETTALVQRRLGLQAAQVLRDDLLAVVDVEWVGREQHEQAMAATIAAARRDVSLVDRVSFEMMRTLGVRRALAFDADFEHEGFELIA